MTTKPEFIKEEFDSYMAAVYSGPLTDNQTKVIRAAFYAGAACMFYKMITTSELIDDIQCEIGNEFLK